MAATFTGHIYDTVLDIYHAEARFYDAANRQWMSTDPIKDGLNWYQYVGANPVTYFDPDGLELILVQHGVNSGASGSVPLADGLEKLNGDVYFNAGVISKRTNETIEEQLEKNINKNLDAKIKTAIKNSQFADTDYSNYTFKQKVGLLDKVGVDVVIATEFSNKWGSHESQQEELEEIINTLSPTERQKISLVGHSKGGLVSMNTAAYFAKLKFVKLIMLFL